MIQQLITLRHGAGVSQRDVARTLARSRAYVSKVEQCQQRLDPLQLVEWLRALQADEQKFLIEVVAAFPEVAPDACEPTHQPSDLA